MDKYRSVNRDYWNWSADKNFAAGLEAQTGEYPIGRFLADPDHISEVVSFDRTELGDVGGKTLLHLQCHIGTDTLSWARLGATVTGVDLSDRAIERARELSRRCGTPGTFVETELFDSPNVVKQKFDVVYTGVGALCWIPDIRGWAQVVSGFLKQGGHFYVRDGHPMLHTLDNERDTTGDADGDNGYRIVNPYFEAGGVMEFYIGKNRRPEFEWGHGIGEIVTALIDAGLRIEFVHEHKFSGYRHLPQMVEGGDGLWRLPDNENLFPLMFSIRATKS